MRNGTETGLKHHPAPSWAPSEPLRETGEVVEWCAVNAERLGVEADLVGRWVWITFEAKPSAEVRSALKAAGFRWCTRRGAWAHNCGHWSLPSRRAHPFEIYGRVPVGGGAALSETEAA